MFLWVAFPTFTTLNKWTVQQHRSHWVCCGAKSKSFWFQRHILRSLPLRRDRKESGLSTSIHTTGLYQDLHVLL